MNPALGDTKRVWHVVGPDTGKYKGVWYCQDSQATAEALLQTVAGAQMTEGIATYSVYGDGSSPFWAVRRPRYRPDGPRIAAS